MKLRMTLKKQILTLNILPLFLMGLMVIVLSLTLIKTSLISEVETSLRSTATAVLSAYDQNAGNYMEAANGDIWKGSYNISKLWMVSKKDRAWRLPFSMVTEES